MTARIVAPVVMGLAMLGLWEAVVRLAGIPPYVLPGPLLVARTLIDDWGMLAPALVGALDWASTLALAARLPPSTPLIGTDVPPSPITVRISPATACSVRALLSSR